MSDVFFYVQNLLGIGHLRRAAVLAKAMAEAGLTVDFVAGGFPVPGLDLAPLLECNLRSIAASGREALVAIHAIG
jgi:predicted glycosyltransferase